MAIDWTERELRQKAERIDEAVKELLVAIIGQARGGKVDRDKLITMLAEYGLNERDVQQLLNVSLPE